MSMSLERPKLSDPVDPNIFEGLHVRRAYLERFVHDKLHMKKGERHRIENHLSGLCPGKQCQHIIDEIVEQDERNDSKLSQISRSNR